MLIDEYERLFTRIAVGFGLLGIGALLITCTA
jgi:hypothetical protein